MIENAINESAVQDNRTVTAAAPGSVGRYAGKYLTFALNKEIFGINILKVREIINMQPITRVPECENHLKGVINLRGQIIAVIDLRLKFGVPELPYGDETSIIITSHDDVFTGIVVDHVEEVIDLKPENIEPKPSLQGDANQDFILAMGKTENNLMIILDSDSLLST